jgi:catechol 2,3-dioxygenase-like lactoylglutathione lyase family enzyme
MIVGMNHVGLSVADLSRSLTFYRDLLGMELVVQTTFEGEKYATILGLQRPRGKVALLRLGSLQIELFEFEDPPPTPSARHRPVCDHGITHFCLQVTNLEQEYRRLAAAGVAFHCAPINFFGQATATYGRDPDGNAFELIELPEPGGPQQE